MATLRGRKLNTTQQGYGATHQALRRQVAVIVERGDACCSRCGEWIEPGTPWALDHSDDRRGYLGPSHRTCNARDGQRKATRARLSGPRLDAYEAALARNIAWAEAENQYWAEVARASSSETTSRASSSETTSETEARRPRVPRIY